MSGRPTINETYHPQGFGASPSLQRARKPYNFGNFLIGSSLALFAAGVYTYSISSVKQDDFSDVEDLLPPLAERKNITTIEDEYRSREASKAATLDALAGSGSGSTPVTGSATAPSSMGAIGAGGLQKASDVGVADAELGIGASSTSPAAAGVSSGSGTSGIKLPSVSSFWSSTPSSTSASSVGVADAELGIGSSSSTTSLSSSSSSSSALDRLVTPVGAAKLNPITRLYNYESVRRLGLVEPGKGNVLVWGAPNVDNVGKVWDGDVRRNKGGRIV